MIMYTTNISSCIIIVVPCSFCDVYCCLSGCACHCAASLRACACCVVVAGPGGDNRGNHLHGMMSGAGLHPSATAFTTANSLSRFSLLYCHVTGVCGACMVMPR